MSGAEADTTTTGARQRPGTSAARPGTFGHKARSASRRGWASAVAGSFAAALSTALSHRRLFCVLPFFAIAGLTVYRVLPYEPQLMALVFVGVILMAALASSLRNVVATQILLVLSAFWIGFSLLGFQGALSGTRMLTYAEYGSYSASVDEVLSDAPDGQRVIISRIVPDPGEDALPIRRARLYVRSAPLLSPGDVIHGAFRFAAVPGPVVPGGYDAQFQSYFDGIGSFASTTGAPTIVRFGEPTWVKFVVNVRRAIGRRIDAGMSEPASGIARALTIGDQSRISDDTRKQMATAGLAHVLAISGLHLTLIAGGVFWVVRALLALSRTFGQRVAAKSVAALGGMVAALVYLTLSGASVSAIRATIMLMLVFGAILAGRRALTMRNVAIAAVFLIVADPASVFRPSFQLSFAAVTALVGVYEMLRGTNERDSGYLARIWRFVAGTALTSLIAGGATVLFAAYHFQQTAPLGVLGNVLALPIVGFVVLPAAFLSMVAMPFGMEGPLLWALGWGIDRILGVAGVISAWSAGIAGSPLLLPVALVFGVVVLGWFAFFRTWHRFLGPALAIPLIVAFGLDTAPDVLVADSTQAIAVRDAGGMNLIAGRTGSFATNVWSETYQVPIGSKFGDLHCDNIGCIARSPAGFTIALEKQDAGFAEDCWRADLVIARIAAPVDCRAHTQVIDAGDIARGGVQWLHWNPTAHHFTIRSAMTSPNRPWRPGG